MTPLSLAGARFAVAGGVLRIVAGFIPYVPGSAALEAFYGVIDICLLLGLIGIVIATADRLGRIGHVGFVVAVTGQASIIGPDPVMFGIDFYLAGSGVLLIGLAVLAWAMLSAGMLRGAAIGWLLTLALAVAGAVGGGNILILAAGIMLGVSFVLAGRAGLHLMPPGNASLVPAASAHS